MYYKILRGRSIVIWQAIRLIGTIDFTLPLLCLLTVCSLANTNHPFQDFISTVHNSQEIQDSGCFGLMVHNKSVSYILFDSPVRLY